MSNQQYHKLLEKQIRKYFPADLLDNDQIRMFMDHVNNSYSSFDRDKELMDHAFSMSETEFNEVNQQLKNLANQRLQSIEQLNETINVLTPETAKDTGSSNHDLVSIAQKIKSQVAKNKAIELSLQHNINLFKTLLANLQSAILVETEDRKILFTNQLFCKFFKIPLHPDEMVGFDCTDAADQSKSLFKNPAAFVESITELISKRKARYKEILETVDGKLLERDYIPIYIDDVYKGHLWKYTDVTESIKYQNSLKESEERNRLVMHSSMDGIVIANSSGEIEYWNPRAEAILGWTAEEALGKDMASLFIPKYLTQSHKEGLQRFNISGQTKIMNKVLELPAINKAGKEFPVELIVVTYQQNGQSYFCGFIKDIENRKISENLLKSQEEKYRNIIANMNLGMIEVDMNETILSANQSFSDISGFSIDELVGSNTSMFLPTEDDKNLINEKRELRTQGVSDTYEITVTNKQGERRHWFVSGAPNYNDKGEMIGTIGIHLDVTNQKKLERDLEIAKQNAEEASQAKESFLANMSHEIRTPLNAIIGMIRELGRESLSSKQHKYLSNTDSAARHLLSIVNSILDISKIEAGELTLDDHDFSLQALVANIISMLHDKAVKNNIQLSSFTDDRLWKVFKGDSARLRQVLINLLDNAIKFTKDGYVNLNLTCVREKDNTQEIKIIVSDTGIGMDSEYLKQVFSKFSQEEKSTSRRFGGTGLGMSITYEIIKMMHGSIDVRSEKGKGTTIIIDLKLQKGDIRNLTEKVSIDQNELQGYHILLVEDNVMNRFIARQSLQYFGCKVDEAENGMIALDLLKHRTYDAILMDIQMPELDGVETTIKIRTELNLDTPIIAITANAFKKDIDLYLKSGMDDYVTKPFEEHVLYEVLAHHLKKNIFNQSVHSYNMPLYDLSKLLELSRGDHQFVIQMIDIFINYAEETVMDMEDAINKENYIAVGKLAHRIKPSIDNMGIKRLDGVARTIEMGTKDEHVNKIDLGNAVTHLCTTLSEVCVALKKYLEDSK